MKKKRTIAAGKFKAECLSLLNRVAETGEAYVVTKRGRPVAEVVPISKGSRPRPLLKSVTVLGDIVGPVLDSWNVDR